MKVRATSPLRVDIGGGVTDIPEIGRGLGTSLVNLAIDLYEDEFYKSKIAITVVASASDTNRLEFNDREVKLDSGEFLPMMFKSFLKKASLKSGVTLSIEDNLPAGTGLGGSAALSLSTLASIFILGNAKKSSELVKIAHHFETAEQGIQGGFQDFIAAYFGGLNYITSNVLDQALLPDGVLNLGQRLPKNVEEFLNQNMIFAIQRTENISSGIIVNDEVENFLHNREMVTSHLQNIKYANDDICNILLNYPTPKWIDNLANQISISWDAQKQLSTLVGRGFLRDVEEAVQPYVYALRGPGAGGNSLFFLAKPERKKELIQRLHDFDDRMVVLYGQVNNTGLEILKT